MTALRTVLVATDLSERASRAEVRAARLSAEHKVERVELLNVKEPPEAAILARITGITEASAQAMVTERTMQELAARTAVLKAEHGIDCASLVRFGSVATEITAYADEIDASLLVVGAHGGNFFSDLFLGNTADKLVHLCNRPVLVVKNEPRKDYRDILVPVDFSDDSRRAAALALNLAPTAHVSFLHAFEVPFEGKMQYAGVSTDLINNYRMQGREEARINLNRFIDELAPEGRHVSRAIEFGLPGPFVRDYARRRKPDLIVMGKHGRSRFAEMIIGSVTRDAIEQTMSDVLVVPAAARDTLPL